MNTLNSRVGLIGGAGPMAGALLFEKIITVCQKYGCKIDSEFPYCILLSYPFSPILTNAWDRDILKKELENCFRSLEMNQVSIVAISCNTLHSFLPDIPKNIVLVHMIEETQAYVNAKNWKDPLILCSSTSRSNKLHAQYFSCRYPNPHLQSTVDMLIDKITEGCCFKEASKLLSLMCKDEGPVVLGCTELTLLHERVPLELDEICSPDTIVAEKIGELIFARNQ